MAFLSGGFICAFGQFLQASYLSFGIEYENALLLVSISLILISAVLTAAGIYSKLGKYCGAGTEVPITGFANSVVSPAIEYQCRADYGDGGENVRHRRAGDCVWYINFCCCWHLLLFSGEVIS